ncbi:MAG: cyclase family protein [Woeseia sp.]
MFLAGCASADVKAGAKAELVWSDAKAPAMSRVEFDQLMQDISNWGRWGSEDQLGTLNLITPEKRVAAARLVRHGLSLSLALDMDKQKHALNANPFKHEVQVVDWAGHRWAGDRYEVSYHGWSFSHLDGLQHVSHKGMLYNGTPIDSLSPEGTARLGIQNVGVNGIFTRGVLIDFPRFLGVDFIPAGTAISVADIEAWEAASGVTVSSGDVLLVRTGRWVQVAQEGQWNIVEKAAGLHASVAAWLRERDVAVIGADGVSDVFPSGVEGLGNPLHELVIAGLGMPMLDNLDLEAVSEMAAQLNTPVFLFVGSPMRVSGGTGAPLNPLAVF